METTSSDGVRETEKWRTHHTYKIISTPSTADIKHTMLAFTWPFLKSNPPLYNAIHEDGIHPRQTCISNTAYSKTRIPAQPNTWIITKKLQTSKMFFVKCNRTATMTHPRLRDAKRMQAKQDGGSSLLKASVFTAEDKAAVVDLRDTVGIYRGFRGGVWESIKIHTSSPKNEG